MPNNHPDTIQKQSAEALQDEQGQTTLKNQNPNKNHNTKKVSLGPNTKR